MRSNVQTIDIAGGLKDGVAGFAHIDDVLVERGATEDSGDFRARLIRMAESMNARTLVIGGLRPMRFED
jgi:hypothetical protein